MKAFYQLTSEEAMKQLHSSASGLHPDQVAALQREYGENALAEARQRTKLSILLSQLNDVMIIILVIAAFISFVVGEPTDAYIILAIIVANAWMGFSQENQAENSIRMLKKMATPFALAIRAHHPVQIKASQLVPGDVILLHAGDVVPADARLIEVSSFKTEEASLTGESFSIEKTTEAIRENNLVAGDQHNMVFKGTLVSNGTAKAVVTATGMRTEIGKIAGLMEVKEQRTPLQKRLSVFSRQLAVGVIMICLLILGFGLWRGAPPLQMFLTALSLAVAALPEALPAVITIALARGASRMAQRKALVRKLPAVETLGSVTYICTDKTGTLTQNQMTVEKIRAVNDGEELLHYALLLNNEVRLAEDQKLLGESTETALVQYALQKGYSKEEAHVKFSPVALLPFDSARMRMSTLHKNGDQFILFVKGAPVKIVEAVAEKHKEQVPQWLETNRAWAQEGLRVLFFAYKVLPHPPLAINIELEKDLDFLGMAALIDPPRKEVREAVLQGKTAGIKTVMITGDQPLTAKAIAERLTIRDQGSGGIKTGAELDQMSDEEFFQQVKEITVYARVSPEQKLKIVKALQHNGEFVAMTGDGVNDAPSLKQADIGLAMGITGTDVAKEAADMILLDDNFATILKAVREGRRIYENIRKFILYVLSCNLGEILTIFFAPFLGFVTPLLPIHILWINLVTDGLPGIALVAEPAEKDIMNRPPRPPKENLFAGGLIAKILLSGIIMTIATLFIQWWAIRQGYDVRTQQTMVFTTLCFVQLANALSVRSTYHSLLSTGLFSNRGLWGAIILTIALQLVIVFVPHVRTIFKTAFLEGNSILMIVLAVLSSLLCIELLKKIKMIDGR